MGGRGRRQGGVHKNIKAAVHADKKKTALAEAFAQSGPEEFLMEFFNRQQLRHYPVGDEAQNPFGRFECTLCGDALLLPTPNRPQIVHLCKQMGKLDLGVMRRVDMLTAEGACIMCHNIPKNSPHDCPARPMNTTMFDFTCFFDLPRPLPAGISSLDKLAVARNKLKDLALHCLLQGLVTFVMPAHDMLGDSDGALRQGRLQSFSVLVHRNVADGPLCVWSLSEVRPLQDRYHTLEATRPRPADTRYIVPVSDYHMAPYTGELHDRQRGERRSELGSLRLTTSDGRHVVDPAELGSAAMLTSTKRKTANVAIQKISGSHVAYLVPKHAIAAGTRLKCRIADFW